MNNIFLKKVLSKISKFEQDQIDKGVEIEKEHKDTIEKIIEDTRNEKIEPLKEYYKDISLDHLEEVENYYLDNKGESRLEKMEEQAREDLKKESSEEIYPLGTKELDSQQKEQVATELLENIPEALSGSGLQANSWNYDSLKFEIEDEEDNGKIYVINKEKALKGLDLFLNAIKKGQLAGLRLNKNSTLGDFDAEAISAYVQFIIFGELKYA